MLEEAIKQLEVNLRIFHYCKVRFEKLEEQQDADDIEEYMRENEELLKKLKANG